MVTAGPAVAAGEPQTGEPEDLSHLHEAVQRVARLPAAERLAHVRADRWIGYTRATEAQTQLENLLSWPATGCRTSCCSERPTTASR